MAVIKLRHVEHFVDRHGHDRFYFRRGKGHRVTLPGLPGSQEFMAAYAQAVAAGAVVKGHERHPRSFHALLGLYLKSPNFLRLKPSSQYCTRNVMERFAAEHGDGLVTEMTRQHVDLIIGAKAGTPAAANTLLKRVRTLINYAVALGWIVGDPTKGLKKFAEGEYHTWTDAELSQYEAKWPLGTRERTAYALALYTGQRRSDVFRMTWADISGDVIRVVQEKTKTKLEIPLHADLSIALEKWPRTHMTILPSARQKQYTVESFGNLMGKAIRGAGLPAECVFHGLRKAAARRLAEVGCSEHQIAAITGHKSLEEVRRYTRAASQTHMAREAILKLPVSKVGADRNT